LAGWFRRTTASATIHADSQAVDQGGQHFQPPVAIGTPGIGRQPAQPIGRPGHGQRQDVGQHVGGIGHQGQGTGHQGAGGLDRHEQGGDCQRGAQAPLVLTGLVPVMGPMPRPMHVTRVVRMVVPVIGLGCGAADHRHDIIRAAIAARSRGSRLHLARLAVVRLFLMGSGFPFFARQVASQKFMVVRRRRQGSRSLPAVGLILVVDHAEVVLGVLVEVFGSNAVTLGRCVPRHRQVPFEDLVGIAADPHFGAVAVVSLVARRHMLLAAAAAAIHPATRTLLDVLSWFHDTYMHDAMF
jgi:hypothetical protein